MGKIENIQSDKISVRNVDGIVIDFTPKDFVAYLKKENIALSKANVLFSQKKKGILADLVDIYYKKRVTIREESKKIKGKIKNLDSQSKQELEIKIDQLDTKQQAIKIFLNSVYGACANKFCPIGDVDIAESITLTGQSVIKESREIFKRFVTKNKGITNIKELEKGLIAGDTDSLYVSFDQLVDTFSENKKITPATYAVAEEFENWVNSVEEDIHDVPSNEKEIGLLRDLFADELPLGVDGINAIAAVQEILSSDELEKDLENAAGNDPDSDARPVIRQWIDRNLPNLLQDIDTEENSRYTSPS
jgi:DNA polymerase elongation subunit (family B)